ncbi:MAG TPA: hypothetical protein VFQ39_16495, partial [Longimicrobium sp.]|nr:hypothetical protein [Longimicrobium sp.]
GAAHEAGALRLDSSRARTRLGWEPRLPLADAVAWTVDWYREAAADPTAAADLTHAQIRRYRAISGDIDALADELLPAAALEEAVP